MQFRDFSLQNDRHFKKMSSKVHNNSIMAVTKARPIKLFCFAHKFYQKIGVYQPTQLKQNQPFNLINTLLLYNLLQFGITTGAFFLFEATSLDEFGLTFYETLTVLSLAFYHVTNIYQIGNVLKLIENFEEFIGTSKLNLFRFNFYFLPLFHRLVESALTWEMGLNFIQNRIGTEPHFSGFVH